MPGYPRYTKDIDFWVWLNEANVKNLLRSLDAFGFGSLGLSAEDFMNPTNVVQLGRPLARQTNTFFLQRHFSNAGN